jgi:O-acetyl-ADP-ribose deacetylase (regulator of RNase III)
VAKVRAKRDWGKIAESFVFLIDMIHFIQGDLFASGASALVNPVNTVGVMGKGLALVFKKRFPDNFAAYRRACKEAEIQTGTMFIFDRGQPSKPRWIVNFPTKEHFRNKSQIIWIESGLHDLRAQILDLGISSIALPALGCGLGGLKWEVVRKLIETILADLTETDIYVFPPR